MLYDLSPEGASADTECGYPAGSITAQPRCAIAMKKVDSVFNEDEVCVLSTTTNVKVQRSLTIRARTRGTVSFSKGDFRSLMSSVDPAS